MSDKTQFNVVVCFIFFKVNLNFIYENTFSLLYSSGLVSNFFSGQTAIEVTQAATDVGALFFVHTNQKLIKNKNVSVRSRLIRYRPFLQLLRF